MRRLLYIGIICSLLSFNTQAQEFFTEGNEDNEGRHFEQEAAEETVWSAAISASVRRFLITAEPPGTDSAAGPVPRSEVHR